MAMAAEPMDFTDPDILRGLLNTENRYFLDDTYYQTMQDEIDEGVRRICLEWMFQVCEEENCENCIYPIAVNIMDRFLGKNKWRKIHLQLLCCAGLLLASKLRQDRPLSVSKLSYYTEDSCYVGEILSMETLVVNALHWSLRTVVPVDYIDTILHRLPEFSNIRSLTKRQANVFVQILTMEGDYPTYPPSHVAIGAIGAAIRGIQHVEELWPHVDLLSDMISQMTEIPMGVVEYCIERVVGLQDKWRSMVQQGSHQLSEFISFRRDNIDDDDDDYPPVSIMDFAE